MSQQCALAAVKSGNMWVHINRTAVRSKGEIIPLFLGLLIKGKLQAGAHSVKITKMVGKLMHLPCEERLREWGLFILGKSGKPTVTSQHLLRRLARKHRQAPH